MLIKVRPHLTGDEVLEMVNSLILLARDNRLSVLEGELLELENALNANQEARYQV